MGEEEGGGGGEVSSRLELCDIRHPGWLGVPNKPLYRFVHGSDPHVTIHVVRPTLEQPHLPTMAAHKTLCSMKLIRKPSQVAGTVTKW